MACTGTRPAYIATTDIHTSVHTDRTPLPEEEWTIVASYSGLDTPGVCTLHPSQLNPPGSQLDATRLPACGFTYCLLSLQSTFQLSLMVLVRYRTRGSI